MKKVYERTKGIIPGAVSGFCPGCMHSTIHKLIGEVAEDLGKLDKLVRVEGVGCCGLGQFYVTHDETIAAHGRACAVATGIKRSSPDSLVYTYQEMETWLPSDWLRQCLQLTEVRTSLLSS